MNQNNTYIIKLLKEDVDLIQPVIKLTKINLSKILYSYINEDYAKSREEEYKNVFSPTMDNNCMRKTIILTSEISEIYLNILKSIRNGDDKYYEVWENKRSIKNFLKEYNLEESDIEVILKDEKFIVVNTEKIVDELYREDIEKLVKEKGVMRLIKLNEFLNTLKNCNTGNTSPLLKHLSSDSDSFNNVDTSESNYNKREGYFTLTNHMTRVGWGELKEYILLKDPYNKDTLYLSVPKIYVSFIANNIACGLTSTLEVNDTKINKKIMEYEEFKVPDLIEMFKYVDINIITQILKQYRCETITELITKEIAKLQQANITTRDIIQARLEKLDVSFSEHIYDDFEFRIYIK